MRLKKDDIYNSKPYKKLVKIGENRFIKLPFSTAGLYSLSPVETMIYAYISNATFNLEKEAFTDTLTVLQAFTNSSYDTVRKSVEKLIYKGLIAKSIEDIDGIKCVLYKALVDINKPLHFTDKKDI